MSKPLKKAARTNLKASKSSRSDGVRETSNTCEDDDTLEPYADEPIVDEEWLKRYRKEQEEKRRLEEDLTKRLENRVRVNVLVDGKVLTLHFAYALFITFCQNYGQVLTYIRTNYFPCRCTCGNCSRDLPANNSERPWERGWRQV